MVISLIEISGRVHVFTMPVKDVEECLRHGNWEALSRNDISNITNLEVMVKDSGVDVSAEVQPELSLAKFELDVHAELNRKWLAMAAAE